MKAAYADPPYLGLAEKFYGHLHPDAADYDRPETHRALIERMNDEFDCWAMSLHSPSLHTILPMCPPDVRVAAWVKPFASFKPNVTRAFAWEEDLNKVFFGDCRDTMRGLIAQGVKVQMCVTSPPYFNLRDYGHAGQIGLEATPAEYVAAMVEVFDLVREMLSDDGVLWLNLGDSYVGSANNGGTTSKTMDGTQAATGKGLPTKKGKGLKPKDLIGIPWRVAFALQEAGWYLRQDIIWHKPNPMPESVRDRCTKAHEYLFLLSKRERYYFDADAIAQPISGSSRERLAQPNLQNQVGSNRVPGKTNGNMKAVGKVDGLANRRSVWTVPTVPYSGAHFATFPPALIEPCILAGSRPGDTVLDCFFGSGTTGQVAGNLGRQWIGCELNPDYASLHGDRLKQPGLSI